MKNKNSQKGNTLTEFMLFFIALMVVAILVATFAFKIGYNSGANDLQIESDVVINGKLVDGDFVKAMQQENKTFESASNQAKQERDISISNISNLKKQYEELTTKNLQLSDTLKVFSETIAKQGGIPLQVIASRIKPLPENAFEYHFDVAMVSTDGKEQDLEAQLKLINETSFVSIPLSKSNYKINGVSYIRGRFVMPNNFEPKQLKLSITAGSSKIEKLYNWKKGKRVNSTYSKLSDLPSINVKPIGSE